MKAFIGIIEIENHHGTLVFDKEGFGLADFAFELVSEDYLAHHSTKLAPAKSRYYLSSRGGHTSRSWPDVPVPLLLGSHTI